MLGLASTGSAQTTCPVPNPGEYKCLDFKPNNWTHPAFTPDVASCLWSKVSRTTWSTGSQVPCDFDLVVGPVDTGSDQLGIKREKVTTAVLSTGGQPNDDGYVYQVKSGYALLSGRFPLMSGRRVRAASDGTQFAIELLSSTSGDTESVTERVYFLTTKTMSPVVVEIFDDENQHTDPLKVPTTVTIANPGDVLEVTWTKQGANAPGKEYHKQYNLGTASECSPQMTYFACQMYILLYDPAVPQESRHPLPASIATNFKIDTAKGAPDSVATEMVLTRKSLAERLADRMNEVLKTHLPASPPSHNGPHGDGHPGPHDPTPPQRDAP
jgi:hypothetical protein